MTEEPKEKLPDSQSESKVRKSQQEGIVVGKVRYFSEQYSGPLPRPIDLQEYDRVVPGSADRILKMAENQAIHRQQLEKTVISGDSKRAFCGLWIGAFVALCVLGGAVFLIFEGHDWAGSAIAGLDIVGLVSVFVYGTVSRRHERVQKAEMMNNPDTKKS